MSKKRLLADVLWEAANQRLWTPGQEFRGRSDYSCNAIAQALYEGDCYECTDLPYEVRSFLESLGCEVARDDLFDRKYDERVQGVRYVWLLLAMHVAEDEGIEA